MINHKYTILNQVKLVIDQITITHTTQLRLMMLFGAQYHSRKEQLKLAKNFLKNEIVMLAIFVLICVMIASLVDKNTPQTNYTFYYAQNKIVNKHTRGIFPPLQGKYTDLVGCWYINAKIGQIQFDLHSFSNYTICFRRDQTMTLKKIGSNCSEMGSVLNYKWNTYSHNMFITQFNRIQNQNVEEPANKDISNSSKDTNNTQTNKQQTNSSVRHLIEQNEIAESQNLKNSNQNEQQNKKLNQNNNQKESKQQQKMVICLSEDQQIVKNVLSFTVWTVREGSVFIISEVMINENIDVSIFVLKKVQ